MSNYTSLEAWKEAMSLVKEVYVLSRSFPKEEMYGLISQIRRAAISVPSNIAEGLGRNHRKDTTRFLYIARGSLYELETLLSVSFMTEIIGEDSLRAIAPSIERSLKLLNGLIRYYEKAELK